MLARKLLLRVVPVAPASKLTRSVTGVSTAAGVAVGEGEGDGEGEASCGTPDTEGI